MRTGKSHYISLTFMYTMPIYNLMFYLNYFTNPTFQFFLHVLQGQFGLSGRRTCPLHNASQLVTGELISSKPIATDAQKASLHIFKEHIPLLLYFLFSIICTQLLVIYIQGNAHRKLFSNSIQIIYFIPEKIEQFSPLGLLLLS